MGKHLEDRPTSEMLSMSMSICIYISWLELGLFGVGSPEGPASKWIIPILTTILIPILIHIVLLESIERRTNSIFRITVDKYMNIDIDTSLDIVSNLILY